jgi:type IV secretory pathway VirB10-like protein
VPVVGSRFLIEAGFIIAVAVIAGIERLSTWWIIAVVAGAWIIVAIVEIVVWMRQAAARHPHVAESAPPAFVPAPPVRVRVQPPAESQWEPEPEPTAEREPAPEPEPEPQPSSEPPRIVAAPPPPPEPEQEPEPQPEPGAARVVAFLPANDGPREWNLWELERAARDHATDDVGRNEERSYLLMYLREFAGPDGVLPMDFDGLVRDAFGDVLHTVGA